MRIILSGAILAILLLTIVPANERPVTGLGQNVEHFLCFVIVGMAAPLSFHASTKTLLSGATIFALMIELIQIPIPTRHAWFMDFFVDALAGCIGVALVQLAMNFFPGKRVND